MVTATGVRITWSDLPEPVRAGIEDLLGAPVVEARSQPGGFSPGTADRVRTAGGGRAFVKAVHPSLNPHSPSLHREEARITAALPAAVPAPRLLGTYDDGEWIALVLQDIEGRHPLLPWSSGELTAVLDALTELAQVLTPPPLGGLPTAGEAWAEDLRGWHRVSADPPADLHPWVKAHLRRLIAEVDQALAELDGRTGVHMDIRADNLLITPEGRVIIVDWPWLSIGPTWLDSTLLMVNVIHHGGHDVAALLDRIGRGFDVDRYTLRAMLAGFAGFFIDAARLPPAPGLPTVGAWRKAQGEALVAWLAETAP